MPNIIKTPNFFREKACDIYLQRLKLVESCFLFLPGTHSNLKGIAYQPGFRRGIMHFYLSLALNNSPS